MRWKRQLARLISVRVRDAEAEAKRARDMLEAYDLGDLTKVYMLRAGPDYGRGGFEVVLQSSGAVFIVEAMAEILKSQDAPNFLCFDGTHKELGRLSFCVQREKGQTPTEKLKEMNLALAATTAFCRHVLDAHEAEEWPLENDLDFDAARTAVAMAEPVLRKYAPQGGEGGN